MANLEPLDRIVIAYLCLPLLIFLMGWFELWIATPLVVLTLYGLRPLLAPRNGALNLPSLTQTQILTAVCVGCGWTVFGGTGHWFFANIDWHIRDAVLHDLVASPWPVGYGLLDGKETLLRAPIAYFLPAAVVGKALGLMAAHYTMAVWTAIGASLFLLQVLSLAPARLAAGLKVMAIVILFSGLDIIGQLLQNGPRFRAEWNIVSHLEWWARFYQYSSVTTQLFWVPNHAIGGWLAIGLLSKSERNHCIDLMLPMVLVVIALWSPLTALGVVPFALWKATSSMARNRSLALLHPRVWVPALVVGLVIGSYLTLDPGGIPRTWTLNLSGDGAVMGAIRQAQFFLLEAGLIGFAILAIRRSYEVILALVILGLLPLVSFGAANDFVMRASIPSLAVICIGACRVLTDESIQSGRPWKRPCLVLLLGIGAVTPLHEFARAVVIPSWPINLQSTLVGADCGGYPAHYVARIKQEPIRLLMKKPNRLMIGDTGPSSCVNPAEVSLQKSGFL